MLGLGWTEMLVIGVVALIFIGPKDLPVVMNQVGKIFGQIRRMSNDFQREINRTTGLDEVRNLRNSITAPLKKTTDEIRKEFNAMTPNGPKPSGKIKPADPNAESVVDEIKAAAGMTAPTPPKTADEVAAESGFKAPATTPRAAAVPKPAATKPASARKPAARKAPSRAKAAPTRKVVSAELPPLDAPAVEKPAPKRAAARKAAAPAKPKAAATPKTAKPETAPAAAPKPRKRAAAGGPKTAAPKADTPKAEDI
jgi:sec-independent protein translocase protein TatB